MSPEDALQIWHLDHPEKTMPRKAQPKTVRVPRHMTLDAHADAWLLAEAEKQNAPGVGRIIDDLVFAEIVKRKKQSRA